jgi:hypothetical protein
MSQLGVRPLPRIEERSPHAAPDGMPRWLRSVGTYVWDGNVNGDDEARSQSSHSVTRYRDSRNDFKSSPDHVCIKRFRPEELDAGLAEIDAVKSLDGNVHVVSYIDSFRTRFLDPNGQAIDDKYDLYLVTKWYEAGTLRRWLRNHGAFSAAEARRLIAPLLGALGRAFDDGVAFNDVAPENLLLSAAKNGYLVFIDAENSSSPDAPAQRQNGRPEYRPMTACTAGDAALYAVGLMLWEMLTGESVYAIDPLEVPLRLKELTDERHRRTTALLLSAPEREDWRATLPAAEEALVGSSEGHPTRIREFGDALTDSQPSLTPDELRDLGIAFGLPSDAPTEHRDRGRRVHRGWRRLAPLGVFLAFTAGFAAFVEVGRLSSDSRPHHPGKSAASTPPGGASHRGAGGGAASHGSAPVPKPTPSQEREARKLTAFVYERGHDGNVKQCRPNYRPGPGILVAVNCHNFGVPVSYSLFADKKRTHGYFASVARRGRPVGGTWGKCDATWQWWWRRGVGGLQSGSIAYLFRRNEALLTWTYSHRDIVAVAVGHRSQRSSICRAWYWNG